MAEFGVIYSLRNKKNGKRYIGQTCRLEERMREHAQNQKNRKIGIDPAIQKYGFDNFELTVLEHCLREDLNEREKFWIKEFNTYRGRGYNCRPGGRGYQKAEDHPYYNKPKKNPMYGRTGKSNPLYGKREGADNPFYGKKHTKETREKISEKVSGANNPFGMITKKTGLDVLREYEKTNKNQTEISKEYGISQQSVSLIVRREHWSTRGVGDGNGEQ